MQNCRATTRTSRVELPQAQSSRQHGPRAQGGCARHMCTKTNVTLNERNLAEDCLPAMLQHAEPATNDPDGNGPKLIAVNPFSPVEKLPSRLRDQSSHASALCQELPK